MKYQLYSYDVWGNKKDGYQVNNVFKTDMIIEVKTDSDEELIKELKKCYINKYVRNSSIDIEGETEHTLYITYTPTMYYLCELRRID